MTWEEADRELIAEGCPCLYDMNELAVPDSPEYRWCITERIARREAEARVKELEGRLSLRPLKPVEQRASLQIFGSEIMLLRNNYLPDNIIVCGGRVFAILSNGGMP